MNREKSKFSQTATKDPHSLPDTKRSPESLVMSETCQRERPGSLPLRQQ